MTTTDTVARPMADDNQWDITVAGMPGGTIYQTSMWARAKGNRTRTRRVEITTGPPSGQACAQLLIRRLGPATRVAYVPYGPLYRDRSTTAEQAQPIVAAIETEARAAGCVVVLVQPARGDQITVAALDRLGFQPAPIDVATSATLEIELGSSDDELFSRLSKSRRQSVRRARRRGVTVEVGRRSELVTLVRLYAASAQRQGFLPMSLPYLQRQWDVLNPNGHLELLVAMIEGRAVAAGTMVAFGELAEFKLTGWDGSDQARTSHVNEALNWAMMSRANAAGYRVFDLGGLPRDLAHRAADVGVERALRDTGSAFKHGWGGRTVVHPPTYQKILSPIGHLTYRLPSTVLGGEGLGGRVVNWVRRT